ncbi:MAG TPA: VOC family protein [Conexibacter sp.]
MLPSANEGDRALPRDGDGALAAALGTVATFDHAAHAVPCIDDALGLYAGMLGGRPVDDGVNARVGYRGVQLAFAGGERFELIEPLPGSRFLDSFFARHPRGGLHHVTFLVADVRAAIERAGEAGFDVVGVHLDDPARKEAFLHPRGAFGALVQLVEESAGPGAGAAVGVGLGAAVGAGEGGDAHSPGSAAAQAGRASTASRNADSRG